MLKGRIEFEGKTLTDVEDAIRAALESILNENTAGFDRNENSNYSFEVDGEADPETRVA